MFTVALIVALIVVTVVIEDLLRVVDRSLGGHGDSREIWCMSSMGRLVDGIPMTAVRIVVVVWQIVSQVSARKTKPAFQYS